MKVQAKRGKVTQIMQGASSNYRYVWDVSRGPTPGRATRAAESWGHPLVPLFGLYYLLALETLRETPVSRFSPLFRRRRASKIGSTRSPLPGTLPEGGTTSGSFCATMDASRMNREYSTLDHGSMINSYVMFSSPLCSDLVSRPT